MEKHNTNIYARPVQQQVCGLMCDSVTGNAIVVRQRATPTQLAGPWKGVEAAVEENEPPLSAVTRAFFAVTGVSTLPLDWHALCRETRKDGPQVHFFTANRPGAMENMKMADGVEVFQFEPGRWKHGLYRYENMYYNLSYLVPMAICFWKHPEHRYHLD